METIVLAPVGEVDDEVLELVYRAISAEFDQPCRIDTPALLPDHAYHPLRDQWSANVILQMLRPINGNRVLGVVDQDLFVPQMSFVFGHSRKRGHVAVIGLARLREEFYHEPASYFRTLERSVKIAIHEVGHTYGLDHCRDPLCVMSHPSRLDELDNKGAHLCPECRAQYERMTVRERALAP